MKNEKDLTAEELKDLHVLTNMHILMMRLEGRTDVVEHYSAINDKLTKIIVAKEIEENEY